MKKTGLSILGLLAAIAAYVLLWPVPIDPVAWNAPTDRGLTGAFSANNLLTAAKGIDLGDFGGPEDAALGDDRHIYATTEGGDVIRIAPNGRSVELMARVGGRPLGIEADDDGSFVVANAYHGLQRVWPDGSVESLVAEIDGQALVYVDDLAIADDGRVFFTEASTKFAAEAAGDTMEAALFDIMEHGGHGLVIEYDPATDAARVIMDGINFANGIAISEDQRFLLIAETGSYRILRYWLEGPTAGTTDVLIDNLPGAPDNINNGLNGRFWVGLIAPRNALLDRYAGQAWVRKIMQRMPQALRPRPVMWSHVFSIDGDGEVLMNLQDPDARYPLTTGVLETRDSLYITVLQGHALPRVLKEELLQ